MSMVGRVSSVCRVVVVFSKTDIGKTKGEEHLCSHDLLHPGSTTDPCSGNENSCFHWDSMTHNGDKVENIKVCCCSGNL